MKPTKQMIEKAKKIENLDELLAKIKEYGIDVSEAQATEFFYKHHGKEIFDENLDTELNNVSGGKCYHEEHLVVSALNYCDDWICKECGKSQHNSIHGHRCDRETSQEKSNMVACCASCKYCDYEDALWLCKK